jgi:hypothetical protein
MEFFSEIQNLGHLLICCSSTQGEDVKVVTDSCFTLLPGLLLLCMEDENNL